MASSMGHSDQNGEDRSDNTILCVKSQPLCQVEGCNVDLTKEKAYNIKRRLCSDHVRADAVYCRGQEGLWRFCFQCGKLEPLSRFEGNKRSCRTRLAQRKQRETRKCLSDLAYRYNRASKTPMPSASNFSSQGAHPAPLLQDSLQDVPVKQQVSLQHQHTDVVPSMNRLPASPRHSPSQSQPCVLPTVQEEMFEGTVSAPLASPVDLTAYAGSRRSPFPSRSALPEPPTTVIAPVNPTGTFSNSVSAFWPAHAASASVQQSLGPGSFAPSSAAMAAMGDQNTVVVPIHGNLGGQGLQQPSEHYATRSCLSAPLPAIPAAYLPARACTPVAASVAPAACEAPQSADAVARYATLLDDLLLEMNSDASAVTAPAAVNYSQGMHLDDLPMDDLLPEHSDAELRQVLEAALEQAAAPQQHQNEQQLLGFNSTSSAYQQSSSHLQPQLPGVPDSLLQGTAVAAAGRYQQQTLMPELGSQSGFSSLVPATVIDSARHSRPPQLQEQGLFSSNSMHGWATITNRMKTTSCPLPDVAGTASASVGSFAVHAVPATAGAGVLHAQGPAMLPMQQQQQQQMTDSARQLQKIQQQQQLLQKVRSHVTGAMVNAMTAHGNVANAPDVERYRTELQMVERQLSEMQDILHVMKLETITYDPATSTCC